MDNIDQLFKVGEIVGSDSIRTYVKKYGLKPDHHIREWMHREDFPRIPLCQFQTKENREIANDQALDLLERMLKVDHVQVALDSERKDHCSRCPDASLRQVDQLMEHLLF